jgi:hypothetical protein
MGESTAESGPRCGEAEEAKRRPAYIFGGGAKGMPRGAIERPATGTRAPFFAHFPLTAINPLHYPVGLVVAVAMSLQMRFAAGLTRRAVSRRPRSDREGSE